MSATGLLLFATLTFAAPQADDGARYLIWDGDARAIPGGTVAGIRELLAQAEIAFEVDRDAEQALARLMVARTLTTSQTPIPDQAELAGKVAVARANLLLRLGRVAEARDALQHILFASDPGSDRDHMVPADDRLLRMQDEVRRLPDVLALRDTLDRLLSEPPRSGDDRPDQAAIERYVTEHFGGHTQAMDAFVSDKLYSRDASAVIDMGLRAAPSLAALTLADLDFAEPSLDPLEQLVHIDEPAAIRLIGDHLDEGGRAWRLRVAGCLVPRFREGWTYLGSQWSPAEPAWLDVLARLLRDPLVVSRCGDALTAITDHDAATPAIAESLRSALADAGPRDAEALMSRLVNDSQVTSLQSVYEAALDRTEPEIRRGAARMLARLPYSARLRLLAADPDPLVRTQVAWSMMPRPVQKPPHAGSAQLVQPATVNPPPPGEADRNQLQRLCADADTGVMTQAVRAALTVRPPLPATLFEQALPRLDEATRVQLAKLEHPDRVTLGRLLMALARDPSEAVRRAIDERLRSRFTDHAELLAPILEERMTGLAPHLATLPDNVLRTAPGAAALLRVATDHGNDLPPAVLFNEAMKGALDELLAVRHEILRRLDTEFLARAFASSAELRTLLSRLMFDAAAPATELAIHLADQPDAPLAAVVDALLCAMPFGDAQVINRLVPVLSRPEWRTEPDHSPVWTALSHLALAVARIPGGIATIAGNPQITDRVCRRLVDGCYGSDIHFDEETLLAVLDRLSGLDLPQSDAVTMALAHAATAPASPRLAGHLAAAALDGRYAHIAVAAIGRLRLPEHVPVLQRVLNGEVIGLDEQPLTEVRIAAARAIAAFEDAAVVDILLDALRAAPAAYRGQELEGAIREVLESRRRWQLADDEWRRGGAPSQVSREDSIARLVTMLGDEDEVVRTESIRGLALFGEPIVVPFLIPLLKDASVAVQSAARQALDSIRVRQVFPNK